MYWISGEILKISGEMYWISGEIFLISGETYWISREICSVIGVFPPLRILKQKGRGKPESSPRLFCFYAVKNYSPR
jgi:hypothetical protein